MKRSKIDWGWMLSLLQDTEDSIIAQAMGILPTNGDDCDDDVSIQCAIESGGKINILNYDAQSAKVNDLELDIYWLFREDYGVVFDSVTINSKKLDSDINLVSYAFGYLSLAHGRKSIKEFKYRYDDGDEWENYSWETSP